MIAFIVWLSPFELVKFDFCTVVDALVVDAANGKGLPRPGKSIGLMSPPVDGDEAPEGAMLPLMAALIRRFNSSDCNTLLNKAELLTELPTAKTFVWNFRLSDFPPLENVSSIALTSRFVLETICAMIRVSSKPVCGSGIVGSLLVSKLFCFAPLPPPVLPEGVPPPVLGWLGASTSAPQPGNGGIVGTVKPASFAAALAAALVNGPNCVGCPIEFSLLDALLIAPVSGL